MGTHVCGGARARTWKQSPTARLLGPRKPSVPKSRSHSPGSCLDFRQVLLLSFLFPLPQPAASHCYLHTDQATSGPQCHPVCVGSRFKCRGLEHVKTAPLALA